MSRHLGVDHQIANMIRSNIDLLLERLPVEALTVQSPIEKLFMVGLCCVGVWAQKLEFTSSQTIDSLVLRSQKTNRIQCVPQFAIGDYRVDFLLVHRMYDCELPLCVAIECDGHEFHEKTKQQATRDRALERAIMEHNIRVMRFTGAEVWRDAYACAQQAVQLVEYELCDSEFRAQSMGSTA